MRLSVIIPAYNEEKRIGQTLQSVAGYLRRQSYQAEVIVVSDGSQDQTAAIVKEWQGRFSFISLLDNQINQGKGGAVKQGMLAARGAFRLFMDADNSTTLEQIENFWPWLEKDFAVVIGSRRVKGAEIAVHQPWYKEWLGRGGNLVIRILAVPGIADTQAGFKVFTAQAAQEIFSRLTIWRWGFDFEALAIARQRGFKIKEVPIVWVNDAMSHVKLSAYLKTLLEAWQVRKNIWSGKYKTQDISH